METYMKKVKSVLVCNVSEKDRIKYIIYDYTEKQVDNHIKYFKLCQEFGLPPYKALEFFNEHLEIVDIVDDFRKKLWNCGLRQY